jgi:FeS assembly SUF system protein
MSEESREQNKVSEEGGLAQQQSNASNEGMAVPPSNPVADSNIARLPHNFPPVEGNDPILEQKIVEALKTCFDPEIPVNIYELGLIYKIHAPNPEDIKITMTLTSPMCPVAETLPVEVEQKIRAIPAVKIAQVDLTWDPPWNPQMMSEAAKLQLNLP